MVGAGIPQAHTYLSHEPRQRLPAAGGNDSGRAAAEIKGKERMGEMNLREAAQQALDVMEDTRWAVADQAPNEDVAAHDKAMNTLRAALAEDAMQRLTDEQHMIERGTKAWSGVPDATDWIEDLRGNEPVTNCHDKEGGKLPPPSDHLRDATKMVATINETETVEPVAYSYTDARGRTVLVSTNTAPYEDAKPLYTAPPKREPLTEEEMRDVIGELIPVLLARRMI